MPADSNPKVSIVIVVLNAVKTIEAAIISVINQDYPNYELIIIDGISTDGTIEAIKKYQNNIKYFNSEKDSGIY
ncbi:MAG: glycosyltransferase, partial [Pedobacter sp.]|nr:glycosyltransferase [Pedobacter sp.]